MVKTLLRTVLPIRARRGLRRTACGALDIADQVRGKKEPLRPGRWLQYAVGRDWDDAGRRFLAHFRTYADLRPDQDVLDVGCGAGRIALALAPYLTGHYEGFDLHAPAVRWCSTHITPRWPNFHFVHADIRDQQNNRRGTDAAENFVFPYTEESFDFVFLTSVFTHLRPGAARQYLSEISRVLRPGGRCLGSWFVLDEQSWRAVEVGTTQYGFGYEFDGCRVAQLDIPEIAIAYPYDTIVAMTRDVDLAGELCARGNWFGDTTAPEHQDLILMTKPAPVTREPRPPRGQGPL